MNIDGANIDSSPIGANTASTGAFTSLSATGDLTVDTSTLKVDSTNNLVAVGTASPSSYNSNTRNFVIRDSGSGGMTISTGASNSGFIGFNDGEDSSLEGLIGYNHSSDAMSFRTNSVDDRLVIDSSGNVMVGSTDAGNAGTINLSIGVVGSTTGGLQLWSSTSANHYVQFGDTNSSNGPYRGALGYRHGDDAMVMLTAGTEKMRIDSSGRLLLGSDSVVAHANMDNLQVGAGSGSVGINIYSGSGTGSYGTLAFGDGSGAASYRGFVEYHQGDDSIRLGTAALERMRIDSSGSLLVGASSFGADGLSIAPRYSESGTTSQIRWNRANTSGAGSALVFMNNSSVVGEVTYSNSATSYNTSSDYRLKDVKGSIQNGLERTLALNPVEFTWKSDGTISEGFIAHEAQEVFADAVSGEKDGEDMQGMDYGRITPLLVKAIQELSAEVEQLKQQAHDKCEN